MTMQEAIALFARIYALHAHLVYTMRLGKTIEEISLLYRKGADEVEIVLLIDDTAIRSEADWDTYKRAHGIQEGKG